MVAVVLGVFMAVPAGALWFDAATGRQAGTIACRRCSLCTKQAALSKLSPIESACWVEARWPGVESVSKLH